MIGEGVEAPKIVEQKSQVMPVESRPSVTQVQQPEQHIGLLKRLASKILGGKRDMSKDLANAKPFEPAQQSSESNVKLNKFGEIESEESK